jgi:uncharacterized protein (DUF3820 family)
MIISFGRHQGKDLRNIEDKYLIWLVKKDRGDYLSDTVGGSKFKIPEEISLEARKILKEKGYKFIGNRIE